MSTKLDEILADLDCLAAKARESGDTSLSEALLMLRANRQPGTHVRAELELEATRYAERCAVALEQIAKALEPKPAAKLEPMVHTCAANPESCFTCGKLLALYVDCPECGAASGEPCSRSNPPGLHPARFEAAAQKGSSRS